MVFTRCLQFICNPCSSKHVRHDTGKPSASEQNSAEHEVTVPSQDATTLTAPSLAVSKPGCDKNDAPTPTQDDSMVPSQKETPLAEPSLAVSNVNCDQNIVPTSTEEKSTSRTGQPSGELCNFTPNTIRCQCCARWTDVTEARSCMKCAVYGICPPCLTNQHWGHKITRTDQGMLKALVHDDAATTLAKLAKWKKHMDNIHTRGVTAHKMLCDSYRSAYIDALNSGNIERLQAVKEEHVNHLRKSATDSITHQIRFNDDVEALAHRLQAIKKVHSL